MSERMNDHCERKKMPWQLIKEKQVKNVYPELSGLESNDDPFQCVLCDIITISQL